MSSELWIWLTRQPAPGLTPQSGHSVRFVPLGAEFVLHEGQSEYTDTSDTDHIVCRFGRFK